MNQPTYIVENDIDFYKEINDDDNDDDNNANNNTSTKTNLTCMISGAPLDDDHVELPCHHKFNYVSIFKEIYMQKRVFDCIRTDVPIPIYAIKCPYCRIIHHETILPHQKNVPKIFGVNFYSEDMDLSKTDSFDKMTVVTCVHSNCTQKLGKVYDNQEYCRTHLKTQIIKDLRKQETHYAFFLKKELQQISKQNLPHCMMHLKSGERKGKICNRVCSNDSDFCSLHLRTKKNQNI